MQEALLVGPVLPPLGEHVAAAALRGVRTTEPVEDLVGDTGVRPVLSHPHDGHGAMRWWDGWSHDWPYWSQMILHYINGHD